MNLKNNPVQTGFGGGCHWCTEAVFASLKGVLQVKQGWINSTPPNDTFSEAVLVSYFPSVITLEQLIQIHIATHAASSQHNLRHKYRSAVYCTTTSQLELANNILTNLRLNLHAQLITMALPFVSFKQNSKDYLNYYHRDPQKPFCKVHIQPKIDLLNEQYDELVR